MIEELIRIEIEQGISKVIAFRYNRDEKTKTLTKVEFQRKVILEFLRRECNDSRLEIGHYESGAPYVIGASLNISISHSNQLFAINISRHKSVGVDIQEVKTDIEKGVNYYVNDFEKKSLDLNLKNLHVIWSAKEAVYKLMKGNVARYKEDMTVKIIGDENLSVLCDSQNVTCAYKSNDEFILLYTL